MCRRNGRSMAHRRAKRANARLIVGKAEDVDRRANQLGGAIARDQVTEPHMTWLA